jgi:predicted dienelactone hydrolase
MKARAILAICQPRGFLTIGLLWLSLVHPASGATGGLDGDTGPDLAKANSGRQEVPTSPVGRGAWNVAVPAPTGPSRVGTLWIRAVDNGRTDPYLRNGAKRELFVRFWYPISAAEPCKPAPYTSPKVWNYLSQLTGIQLPEVRTNSCANARVAEGAHPVIVASHGYTGTFTDYTFLFEDLASRGYVVASLAHTYESTAVEFPDGRLVASAVGSYLAPGTMRADYASLEFARAVRLADLKFFLSELLRLNTARDNPLAGKLDTARIGVMGHSLGGEVSLTGLEREPRLRAGVLLDGVLSGESALGTSKPVLLVAAGRERWRDDECALWRNLHGPRLAVNLRGADHFTVSDFVWLFKGLPGLGAPAGAMRPEGTISVVRNYVAAFFDAHLLGKSPSPLLMGQSSSYPIALITTQQQQLCRDHPAVAKGGLQ